LKNTWIIWVILECLYTKQSRRFQHIYIYWIQPVALRMMTVGYLQQCTVICIGKYVNKNEKVDSLFPHCNCIVFLLFLLLLTILLLLWIVILLSTVWIGQMRVAIWFSHFLCQGVDKTTTLSRNTDTYVSVSISIAVSISVGMRHCPIAFELAFSSIASVPLNIVWKIARVRNSRKLFRK